MNFCSAVHAYDESSDLFLIQHFEKMNESLLFYFFTVTIKH